MIIPYWRHAMCLGFLLLQSLIITPSITAAPNTIKLGEWVGMQDGRETTGRAPGSGSEMERLGWMDRGISNPQLHEDKGYSGVSSETLCLNTS